MLKNIKFQTLGATVLILAAFLVTLSAIRPAALVALNLNWPPRPDFSHLNEKAIIPLTGSSEGLAVYHQSEWGAPMTGQNNLDLYYMSERGQTNPIRSNQPALAQYYLSERGTSAFSLVALNKASLQRGREADAARYTAMAASYAAKDGASLQRGREADAARYAAMAASYAAKDGASLQRGREADAARYTAMARSYTAAASGTNQQGLALYYHSERNSAPAPAFHYGPPGR